MSKTRKVRRIQKIKSLKSQYKSQSRKKMENSDATVFVFYRVNPAAKTKIWDYGKFPKGWTWIGTGQTIVHSTWFDRIFKGTPEIVQSTKFPREEQFGGPVEKQTQMRNYLTQFFSNLKRRGIIDNFKLANQYSPE